MLEKPVVEKLRQTVHGLEEAQRRFSRTVPVADAVDRCLPYRGLPVGCIHEVKSKNLATAVSFPATLAARIAGSSGNILYVAADRSLYPLGLLPFGIELAQLLYVSVRKQQEVAWVAMEALRCPQVHAVIAMLDRLDLTESRRMQLAAETSGATAFFISRDPSASIASPVMRWKVSPLPGKRHRRFDQPVWELELLYCRGGRPGRWIVEWRNSKLSEFLDQPVQSAGREAKAG